MDEERKSSIIETLSAEEEHKYYVYALCEKRGSELVPFYIGKGQGGRVWEHELETEEELKRIIKEYEWDELEKVKQETSAKHQKINEIGEQNIEKVIIKWGLTSSEAFMAESAIINLLQMNGISFSSQGLTNIANGHASEVEKKNKSASSAARNLDSFYTECVEPPIEWDDIAYSKIQKKAVFRNINVFFRDFCNSGDNTAVRESARGCWRIRETNLPEYLFAMYRDKVVGIYKINGVKKVCDVSEYPCVPGKETVDEEKEMNKTIGLELAKNPRTTFSKLPHNLQEKFQRFACGDLISNGSIVKKGKTVNMEKAFNAWVHRKYYVVEDAPAEMIEKYLNKTIRKNGKAIYGQGGIRYNFD